MSETADRLLMTDATANRESREWTILLERAATGDVSAFEQVMLRTERSVLMTARRMLGNAADAEEAVQEVFLRVYKYLHRFDRTKAFEPWLYRLTLNVCNASASRRPRAGEVISHEDHEIPAATEGPHELLDADQQR